MREVFDSEYKASKCPDKSCDLLGLQDQIIDAAA